MDGQRNGRMDRQMHRWTNRRLIPGWMDGIVDGQTGRTGGGMNGKPGIEDGCMAGWKVR